MTKKIWNPLLSNYIFISQLKAEFLKKMMAFKDKSIGLVSSAELEQSGEV